MGDKMNYHFKKLEKSVGNLRLGGMQPATMTQSLPAIYYISFSMNRCPCDNNTIYFCCHGNDQGNRLIWIDPDHVVIDSKKYRLVSSPSYRACWTTFTIEEE